MKTEGHNRRPERHEAADQGARYAAIPSIRRELCVPFSRTSEMLVVRS